MCMAKCAFLQAENKFSMLAGFHRDNCLLLLDEMDQSFMFPGFFPEIATKKSNNI